jgi:hypothetical protein
VPAECRCAAAGTCNTLLCMLSAAARLPQPGVGPSQQLVVWQCWLQRRPLLSSLLTAALRRAVPVPVPASQSFKTVSAAIGSHPGHMEVKLEFQRC